MNTPDSLFDVSDQVVLVSGGTRGIGRAIAAGFLDRGAQVIITGRTIDGCKAAVEQFANRERLVALPCDVADSGQIHQLVKDVLERFGQIDTLVNVAGVNRRKPTLDVSDDDFDYIVDINLRGAFILAREVGRHMVSRKTGSQIHVASLNTDKPLTNVLPYAVSKVGLGHMAKVMAMEWGPHGVRVNSLAPGFILTDLTQKLWSDEKLQSWGNQNTPLRRLGTPDDMVGTAIFLASPASKFLTGQTIFVDGGFSAGWAWPMPGIVS